MFRFIQWTCLVLAVAVLAPVAAYGDLIAYDGFEYTVGNTVVGQNGGTGWTTSWVDGGYPEKAIIQAPSLISDSGNYLRMNGVSGHCAAYRALDTTLTGTVYISFLGQQNNTSMRGWGVVTANYSGSAFTTTGGIIGQVNSAGASPAVVEYSIYTPEEKAYSGVSTSNLQLVVAAIDFSTGHMDLYVFDADGDYPTTAPSTADASITADYDFGTTNAIRLWAGAPGNTGYADCNIDEVRIGTTWSDAVVPEPSTLVLLATGLIGLLCYAWRKRK